MVLYVVSTPIGNLKDITERAREVLMHCDVVVCESKERALKILNHVGAQQKKIFYMPAPQEENKAEKIAEEIKENNLNAVLITSAGTPAVSDPGSALVKKCREKGIKIVPIPGPSAITSALSVSGIESQRFLFLGFLPKKGKEGFLKKVKEGVEKLPFNPAIVIFESPHRIKDTLEKIEKIFGEDTEVFLGREMTKIHEEYLFGGIKEIRDIMSKRERIKGEITIVIHQRKIRRESAGGEK